LSLLLRLSLHISNFLNAGTSRVCKAMQLKSLERFSQMRGITPPPGSLSSPPYISKTLMHFLAYSALSVCPEALNFDKDLSLLSSASNCDLNQLDKEIGRIEDTRVKALEEVKKWEVEAKGNKATEQVTTTRSKRIQRGSVIFQGMANLIGEEPVTVNEQEEAAAKDIVAMNRSLQESEETLQMVRDQIKEAVVLGKECRAWFGESVVGGSDGDSESKSGDDELNELKDWIQEVFSIIELFQNACSDNLTAYERVARAIAQQENDLKQQMMRTKARDNQKAKDAQKEKKALAMALATAAAAKAKGPSKLSKRTHSGQTSSLRAKRNSIVQHATKKRTSILMHPSSAPGAKSSAIRGKRNSIVNLIKPTASNRDTSGGMAAAMKSIRGSVAGMDGSEDDSDEDDWDSD